MRKSMMRVLTSSSLRLGIAAALVIICAGVVVAAQVVKVSESIFDRVRAGTNAPDAGTKAFDEQLTLATNRVKGRSLFFVPPKPAPPPEPTRPSIPDGPPPKPTRYGGSPIIGMINNQVWLSDGSRLGVGEKNSSVEVISINAPWSAQLRWREVEFKVPFFEKAPLTASKDEKGAHEPVPDDFVGPPAPDDHPQDAEADGVQPKPEGADGAKSDPNADPKSERNADPKPDPAAEPKPAPSPAPSTPEPKNARLGLEHS